MSNTTDWDDFEVISGDVDWDGFEVVDWDSFEEVEDTDWDGFEIAEPGFDKYNPDGSINHKSEYWKGKTAGEISAEMAADKETGHNFPSSYVAVDEPIRGGEFEGVRSQEVTNEAAAQTAENQIKVLYDRLSKEPRWAGKSEEERMEEAKLRYAEGAAETAVTAFTLPVGMSQSGLWNGMKFGAKMLAGEEAAGELARLGAGEDLDAEKSLKEVGTGALLGAGFGAAGHGLSKGAEKLAGYYDKISGTTALEQLNELGKKAKNYEVNKNKFSPGASDVSVKGNVSVADVIAARNQADELVKLNEEGARVGSKTLADSVENPEIKKLLSEASTKNEKVAKKVTGSEGNVYREKVAENIGLRSPDVKADRATAFKKLSQKTDNEFDEIVDVLKQDVKEGVIPKGNLEEVQTFIKHAKSARSASKAGNTVKYERQLEKAEKQLAEIGKGDDFLAEVLESQLTTIKSSSKIASSVNGKTQNGVVADLLAAGVGFGVPMSDGVQGSDLATGAAAAYMLSKGRKGLSDKFTKSVGNRSKDVSKALKGDLGELKSIHKALKNKEGKIPDGMLIKAYMALMDEKGD